MPENWLKSNLNYVLAWLLLSALFVFAVKVNVEVRTLPEPTGGIIKAIGQQK